MIAFLKGILSALVAVTDLFRFVGKNRRWVLGGGAVAMGLQIFGLYLVWFQWEVTSAWWNVVVQIGGTLLVLLLAPYLILLLVQLFLPAVADQLFFVGLDRHRPAWASEFRERKTPSILWTVRRSLVRVLILILGWLLLALLGLVPVLSVPAVALSWLWSVWFVVIELADPYVDRCGDSKEQRRGIQHQLRGGLMGYGIPIVMVMSLPLIGPFFWGTAQAGIARILPKDQAHRAVPVATAASIRQRQA